MTVPLEEPLDPKTYICGRGDSFELNFWGQQNLRLRVTVDMEGRTFIPKVGYVEIVGKTLAEAREVVKRAVHRYYPGLNFDLSLSIPRSFLVHVVGYVTKPGVVEANPIERASVVLTKAGGITGSHRRILIKRRNGTQLTADLVLYEQTGDVKYNPFVMDGDVIDVPYPQLTTTIDGPVKRPGTYELVATKDLRELVSLADGLQSAVTRHLPIRIGRKNKREVLEDTLVQFESDGSLPNVPLQDMDRVLIPSTNELQRSIVIIGPVAGATAADEVTSVRRVAFIEGSTVRSVLEASGSVGSSGDLRAAYIRKGNGDTLHVDLEALLVRRDFSADRPVGVGDTIVIPIKRRSVLVEGAIFRPGQYQFNPQFRASEYITAAGGPSKSASGQSNFRLITPDGHSLKLTSKLSIQPGDTIVLPERTFSRSEIVQLVMGSASLVLSAITLVYLVTR
jgi:protein involved in polysaccharide export with SLBB domain